MGIDDSFVRVLEKDRAAFERMTDGMVMSDAQQKNLIAGGRALESVTQKFKLLKDSAIAQFSGTLSKDLTRVFGSLQKNGPALINVFGGIAKTLSHVGSAFVNVAGGMANLTSKSKSLGNAFKMMSIIILAAFAPITAALAGILLIIDDLMTFQKYGRKYSYFPWDKVGFSTENNENPFLTEAKRRADLSPEEQKAFNKIYSDNNDSDALGRWYKTTKVGKYFGADQEKFDEVDLKKQELIAEELKRDPKLSVDEAWVIARMRLIRPRVNTEYLKKTDQSDSNTTNTINLTQNFNGDANPEKVGAAAKYGVKQAISSMDYTTRELQSATTN
jgi:hypothetical protein